MCRRMHCAGTTLIEVMVAMSIFAIGMALTLVLLKWSVEQAEMDIAQTYSENQVQDAVDQIVRDLKETSSFMCTFQNFPEDGFAQTAICFSTARARGTGDFTVVDAAGKVQSRPVWQGVAVYAYASNPGTADGSIFKYVDYTPGRSYTQPMYVHSVTASQILVVPAGYEPGVTDPALTVVFDRLNPPPAGGNQERQVLPGVFRQLSVQMGPIECWNCGQAFTPQPPGFLCPNCGQAGAGPIQLTVSSQIRNRVAHLHGTSTVMTLTNEALSRNQN